MGTRRGDQNVCEHECGMRNVCQTTLKISTCLIQVSHASQFQRLHPKFGSCFLLLPSSKSNNKNFYPKPPLLGPAFGVVHTGKRIGISREDYMECRSLRNNMTQMFRNCIVMYKTGNIVTAVNQWEGRRETERERENMWQLLYRSLYGKARWHDSGLIKPWYFSFPPIGTQGWRNNSLSPTK